MTLGRRLPRPLHPGAWWLWALGLGAAASRTTNPVLLVGLVMAAAYVVAARRTDAPWARSFRAFLTLGLLVVAVRVVFQVLFGATAGGSTVLVTLPELPLPSWAAGVRIGGQVTLEGVVLAVYDGLRLAAVLICIGAANALADPRRLLRSVPGALYEAGVAVVVALTYAPRLVEDATRTTAAHRLRGRPVTGVRGVGRIALPVLEGSLERSLDLAAAMDARGFGRRAVIAPGHRRASAVLVCVALIGICVGVYGLLDSSTPSWLWLIGVGGGAALAIAGFALAGRGSVRTRYRKDPWQWPEWGVTGCGALSAALFVVASGTAADGMNLMVVPLVQPVVPPLALAGVVVAMLPALVAPPVPRAVLTAPAATPHRTELGAAA